MTPLEIYLCCLVFIMGVVYYVRVSGLQNELKKYKKTRRRIGFQI